MTRMRPNGRSCPSIVAAMPSRIAETSGLPMPSPSAERTRRSRWRVSAKGDPSSILIVSNTPSPTMMPWSSTPIAGCSGDSNSCPSSHANMPSRYPCSRSPRFGFAHANRLRFRVAPKHAVEATRTWLSGRASPCQGEGRGFESRRPLGGSRPIHRWVGREARQRTANPFTRVQIPYPPQHRQLNST